MKKELTMYRAVINARGTQDRKNKYGSGAYYIAGYQKPDVVKSLQAFFQDHNMTGMHIDHMYEALEIDQKTMEFKNIETNTVYSKEEWLKFVEEFKANIPYSFTPKVSEQSTKEHFKPNKEHYKDRNVPGAFGKESDTEEFER